MDLGEEDDEFGIEIDDGPDERRGGSKNDRQGGRDKPKVSSPPCRDQRSLTYIIIDA